MSKTKSKKKNDEYISNLKKYINHLCNYYDCDFCFDRNIIYIYGNRSTFKVDMRDGKKYNRYKFMHKNSHHSGWHFQGNFKCMKYGIYCMASHDFNVDYGIPKPCIQDYNRFCEDYSKLRKYNKKHHIS